MEITGSGGGAATLPQSQVASEGAAEPFAVKPGTTNDSSDVLGWAKWLIEGDTSTPSAGDAGAPAGAPPLDAPKEELSQDDLVILITTLQEKVSRLLMATSKQEIKASEEQKQCANKEAIAKIKEAVECMKAAAEKADTMKGLMIAAKVIGFVAAVGLTVCTAGVASPVALLFLAWMTVDMACFCASEANQANGGERCDLDYLICKGITEAAEANGSSKEEAQEIGQWATLAIQLTIALASIGTGIGAIKAGGDALLKLSGSAMKIARIAQNTATIASGTTQIASSSVGITRAEDVRNAEYARADKTELDKAIMVLTQFMQSEIDRLKQLVEDLDEAYQQASDVIAAASKSRTHTIANMA